MQRSAYGIMLTLNRALPKKEFLGEYRHIRVFVKEENKRDVAKAKKEKTLKVLFNRAIKAGVPQGICFGVRWSNKSSKGCVEFNQDGSVFVMDTDRIPMNAKVDFAFLPSRQPITLK